jgi:hypothetical protein
MRVTASRAVYQAWKENDLTGVEIPVPSSLGWYPYFRSVVCAVIWLSRVGTPQPSGKFEPMSRVVALSTPQMVPG